MPKQLVDLGGGRPLLDIASYARRGPGRRDRLSPAEVEQIARTVRRTPEVMVKVLNQGGRDLGAIRRHIDYLDRGGELEIETDDGQRLTGKGVAKELLEDWDLDLEARRPGSDSDPREHRSPPKLVHKLMFSMPAGTPPDKMLVAVKNFAREEFALKHRYAMVLHTDEPHPHVHMVVKAVSEDGMRLNIRKQTLRNWRGQFAHALRQEGVSANATERAVRGLAAVRKRDGIYRAMLRGDSVHMRDRVDEVARELRSAQVKFDPHSSRLIQTRKQVEQGWRTASELLKRIGQLELSAAARAFVSQMPLPQTEKAMIASELSRLWRQGTQSRTTTNPSR